MPAGPRVCDKDCVGCDQLAKQGTFDESRVFALELHVLVFLLLGQVAQVGRQRSGIACARSERLPDLPFGRLDDLPGDDRRLSGTSRFLIP